MKTIWKIFYLRCCFSMTQRQQASIFNCLLFNANLKLRKGNLIWKIWCQFSLCGGASWFSLSWLTKKTEHAKNETHSFTSYWVICLRSCPEMKGSSQRFVPKTHVHLTFRPTQCFSLKTNKYPSITNNEDRHQLSRIQWEKEAQIIKLLSNCFLLKFLFEFSR